MSVIPKEQILRLNCPGFGEEGYLTLGKARPLDTYSVIVANPVSILHLFDRDADAVKEVDGRLAEGAGSYILNSDNVLHDIEGDLKQRIFELVSFLEKGGLLVYFLCRPFMVQGPTSAMDNYYWLESLAPDSPAELNVRHMSAVSHGRIVEPTDQAEKSEFATYFKQTGLEWNTIIRSDFLTEGYIVLATAGPRKCIAAHLIAGDNGGRILFLPAPYSPDFDRTLMDCVNTWNKSKQSGSAIGMDQSMFASEAPAQPELAQMPAAAPVASAPAAAPTPPPPAPYMSSAAAPPTMFAGLDSNSYYSTAPVEPAAPPQSTYMPPVPKFNPAAAASVAEEERPLTAEAVLDSVSANASNAPVVPKEFNARTTADMPRPELPRTSGELDAAFAASMASDPTDEPPASEKRPGSSRNLLKEMESMAAQPQVEEEPAETAESNGHVEDVEVVESQEYDASSEQDYQHDAHQATQEEPAQSPELDEDDLEDQPMHELQDRLTGGHDEVNSSNGDAQSSSEPIPEAKDLIKKMEEMTKTVTPDWCSTFSFPDLDDLRNERDSLAETIRQTQARISAIDNKLTMLDGLKNALLASDGEELKNACSRVFKRLNWSTKQSDAEQKELLLIGKENAEVIARIVRSTSGAPRPDIAALAQSVLTFWGETEIEPKGLLVACTFVNTAPDERTEPDFTEAMADFAKKKSLCLMTTVQLLCMYRDMELGKMDAEKIRDRILNTNGMLTGFELEPARV